MISAPTENGKKVMTMADLLQIITYLAWLILCVMAFVMLRKWNQNFYCLYEELKAQIEEDDDNG